MVDQRSGHEPTAVVGARSGASWSGGVREERCTTAAWRGPRECRRGEESMREDREVTRLGPEHDRGARWLAADFAKAVKGAVAPAADLAAGTGAIGQDVDRAVLGETSDGQTVAPSGPPGHRRFGRSRGIGLPEGASGQVIYSYDRRPTAACSDRREHRPPPKPWTRISAGPWTPIPADQPPAMAATTVISSPGLTRVANPFLNRMSSSFR